MPVLQFGVTVRNLHRRCDDGTLTGFCHQFRNDLSASIRRRSCATQRTSMALFAPFTVRPRRWCRRNRSSEMHPTTLYSAVG